MTETAVGKNKKYLDLEQTLKIMLKQGPVVFCCETV